MLFLRPIVALETLILIVLVGLFIYHFFLSGSPAQLSLSASPSPSPSHQAWQDLADCSQTRITNHSNWKTYDSKQYGISFSYPPNWQTRTDTWFFQYHDAIYLAYEDKSSVPNNGGGASSTNNAAAYLVFAIPVKTEATSTQTWLTTYVTGSVNPAGIEPEIKNNLLLGAQPAAGLYICGESCSDTLYVLKNQQIYQAKYFVQHKNQSASEVDYENELCEILKTVKIGT